MDALVFGYRGQLGTTLSERLPEAQGIDRAGCDVTHSEQVATVMASYRPDVVFNAAAYNFVDKAEEEYHSVLAVNGVAPGRLAARCREIGARLVQFSTDYVFGDGHTVEIDETRQPAPLSAYGRSKLLGERLALQNNTETFVIRTTGLYSHRRRNFVKTMIRLAVAGKTIRVVNDQFVSPTWVEPLTDTAIALSKTDVFGTYHVVASGACSWAEFASLIFEILDLDVDLRPVSQDEWGAAAHRPSYSALDCAMLRAVGLPELPRWDDMLETFLKQHGQALVDEAAGQG